MRFQPKSEDEVKKFPVLKAGNYECEVISATDKTSQAGNEMIAIVLKAWDSAGKEYQIRDFLMEKMAHKLRHFAAATGQIGKYESGELDASDCQGKTVVAKLTVKHDDTGQYDDKNEVKDYIVMPETPTSPASKPAAAAKTAETKSATSAGPGIPDDDIPFAPCLL